MAHSDDGRTGAKWRQGALRSFFALWLLALGMLLLVTTITQTASTASTAAICGAFILTSVCAGMAKRGRVKLAASTFSLWLLAGVLVLMLTRYGLKTPAITLIAIPLLLSSFFVGSHRTAFTALVAATILVLVYMLELADLLHLRVLPLKQSQLLAVHITAITLVATLSYVAAREIESSQHRLVKQNNELRAIRKKLEDEIVQRRQLLSELEETNRELTRFSHISAHDLQEPLRTITSFSARLEERCKDLNDSDRKMLRFVSQAASRLQQLVSALLEYTQLGQARQLPQEQVPMDVLLEELSQELSALLERTGGSIELQPCPDAVGDATLLKLVFQNLVSNALKYRKEGTDPVVTVRGWRKDDAVHFEVADNGIGIEPQHHQRIFELFQRLHTRSEYEGTGLGLATVSKIVRLHGGDIQVRSTPGEGSVFQVTLPAEPLTDGTRARLMLRAIKSSAS